MRALWGHALGLSILAGVSVPAILGSRLASAHLRPLWFVSGLFLFLLLGILAAFETRRAWKERSPSPGVGLVHGYGGVLGIVLYLVHTELRLPQGGLEIVLAVLFALVAVSALAGALVTAVPGDGGRTSGHARYGLWRQIYLSSSWSLLPLLVLHGMLCHAHGFLARVSGMGP